MNSELTETFTLPTAPYQLAKVILTDWKRPYFGAVPYIQAMRCLQSFDDEYGCDSGRSVGLYFLANAGTWRGPMAKAVKAQIKKLCGVRK